MPSDVATCRACGSTSVMFVGEHVDGQTRNYFSCCNCGNQTPDRPSAKEADADVDWLPAHEVRVR